MNFIYGQILLWAGFLSGALATVFNTENKDDPWSSINWTWYTVSLGVGVVGIVLIRKSLAHASHDERTHSSLKQIRGNLANLVANTRRLDEEHASQTPRQTLRYIEDVLNDDFRDFAEGRESIAREFGLEVFAEVMTEFAAAERSINRAWSASADGYVDEAATCIRRGLDLLQSAEKALTAKAS